MTRRRLDAQDARTLILREADKLFIEKGYTHATMDELRSRCDMSKGNLYYHFKTKEEIFIQVIIMRSDAVMDDFAARSEHAQSIEEKLLVMAELWGEDCTNPYVKYLDEFIRDASISEEHIGQMYHAVQRKNEVIENMIKEGISKGEIKDADPASVSTCVFSMLEGSSLLCMSMADAGKEYYVKIHKDNMKMLLDGLKGESK